MNVYNGKTIRRISFKSMKASKMRNVIAVLAIALTTVLFTSLFTVALSINYSFQQSNFRQCGGWNHGTFKYLTQEQADELKSDPLIKEYGLRLFVGMPEKEPFNKSHVEVGYSDAVNAEYMYCEPVEGRLPNEGTNEAATDTKVLSLLGIEPEIGAEFTLTIDVDGRETTETFTLCGWWEYDEAVVANHVLIPKSRAEEIIYKSDIKDDSYIGTWSLDVMFSNSINIEKNMLKVLEKHGFQSENRSSGDNYIAIGVNWGYTSSQLADNIDPMTAASIAAMLLLIIFTGYLIIYNVFQISVSNDIRFYGLLKTIGTTGRQLKKIIWYQAFMLSVIGIPVGLIIGYEVGAKITPLVLSQLNGVVEDALSISPVIFIGSAVFSLVTVFISCRKPGKMAARVSPVEAVRYTENSRNRSKLRKARRGASLKMMAWANLGRNKNKTIVTIVSLSLAVVLFNMTITFTNGFDMDKYLRNMAADFIVADAAYFQTGQSWNMDMALPSEIIDTINSHEGIVNGGRAYGTCSSVIEYVTEEYFRETRKYWYTGEQLDMAVGYTNRNEKDLLEDYVRLYGMETSVIDRLKIFDGEISRLYEEGGNYIAAVYFDDDYGNMVKDSQWAEVGDIVTLRYVDEWEFYDPETGDILNPDNITEEQPYKTRPLKYRDVDYEVVAAVGIPNSLSYRYYGSDEFVLNAQTFIRDTGTSSVMYYAYDTTDEVNPSMEMFINNYTTNVAPSFDYESRETYAEEFEAFRSMFLMLGSVLSFIVGLVGVLNFLNAILTGILTRKREFAVLQSVGMTGKQLKTMLIWEGMYYAAGSIVITLIFSVVMAPLASKILGSMFWFFTYNFTVMPVIFVAPVFVLLGAVLPLMTYHFVSKHSVVERLREAE